MRSILLDQEWKFEHGAGGGFFDESKQKEIVNLPHDYMILSDARKDAPAAAATGFYTEGVAHYSKMVNIPAEWEEEQIYLKFDGVMMNATVEINGGKAALQHNGYFPFTVDITQNVYPGKENQVNIIVNPSMQPNSRWYSGAGIFRSVYLVHVPKLHIADNGVFIYTKRITYNKDGQAEYAYLEAEVEVENHTLENKMAEVEIYLTRDGSEEVLVSRKRIIQINPNQTETVYQSITLKDPLLWCSETPDLYEAHVSVKDIGIFKTHYIANQEGNTDETKVLFGVHTITADPRHGLCINERSVKLKGGCLHHDNGMLGAVSLYDVEYRKLSKLKESGFNAVRTTHNPPSSVFMEACDRLGIYVFDEAFDVWGMGKQPGDYNQFFDIDWERDMRAFMKRDRNHPSVIIWSTGNEIPERGGLNNGYALASRLTEVVKNMDPSRLVSNGICSYWNGLDFELQIKEGEKLKAKFDGELTSIQNADMGAEDLSWEKMSEPFTNGLDVVGYNYMEDKYHRDHELYPERVILGSENYPKEIGKRWPMVEKTPYVIGDFTWTAYDYIGEAGIGKSVFVEENDPILKMGPFALMSHTSQFPWRLANDADFDINGNRLPQGDYRSVVWGSDATCLYSYNPASYGKVELLSQWGFTAAEKCWNWTNQENHPVKVVVFSNADEVELFVNGVTMGKKEAGEALAVENLPLSFLFTINYQPGKVEAVSYKNGKELSRDKLVTTGSPSAIRLLPEKTKMNGDGHSSVYVNVEVVDKDGIVVPDAEVQLEAVVEPSTDKVGTLAAFGSGNPITAENYTIGKFASYRGRAAAILRSGYQAGSLTLSVRGENLPSETVTITVG